MRRWRGFAIQRLKLKRFWRRPQAGGVWQIFSADYTRYRHTCADNTHSIARLAIFDSMRRALKG
ncbi:hypothetical protein [Klebsiella quasipneumoniae]|uniref:hypothetical protein n=1 Tax=Klebsiella quasipneumoniae TaxID=1463165 RepID=UPI001FB5E983|nr:hypothetical protein [Klebsiella quasipneumoniae subsp. similipneumoniae]